MKLLCSKVARPSSSSEERMKNRYSFRDSACDLDYSNTASSINDYSDDECDAQDKLRGNRIIDIKLLNDDVFF